MIEVENPKRRLVTVQEIAEILQVPKSWIYERTRQGQMAIPHIRLGAYVRFDADAVINFFKSKSNGVMISAANTEITDTNDFNHFGSSREISHQDATSSLSTRARINQGKAGKDKQAKPDLVNRRKIPQEVYFSKILPAKENPQKQSLLDSPNTAILFFDSVDNSDKG